MEEDQFWSLERINILTDLFAAKTKWMGWKFCTWSKLYQFTMVRHLVHRFVASSHLSDFFLANLIDRWAGQALFGTLTPDVVVLTLLYSIAGVLFLQPYMVYFCYL